MSAARSCTYVITDESRTRKPRLTPLPLRRLVNTERILLHKPMNPSPHHSTLNRPGVRLSKALRAKATRFCGRPRASSETSLDVVVFVLVTTFGRQPLRPVPEVVFAVLGCDEIVNAVAGQRNIGGVRVHFTVLVEWSLDVSTIETAHSVSTIYFDDECDVECKTVTNRLRMKWLLTMATYLSTKS